MYSLVIIKFVPFFGDRMLALSLKQRSHSNKSKEIRERWFDQILTT